MPPKPQQTDTGFVSLGDYLNANQQPLGAAYDSAVGNVAGAAQAARVAAQGLAPEAAQAGQQAETTDWNNYQSSPQSPVGWGGFTQNQQNNAGLAVNQTGQPQTPGTSLGINPSTGTASPYMPTTGGGGHTYDPTTGNAYSNLMGALNTEQQAGQGINSQAGLAGNMYGGAGGSGFNASLLWGAKGGQLQQAAQPALSDTASKYTSGLQNTYASAYDTAAKAQEAQQQKDLTSVNQTSAGPGNTYTPGMNNPNNPDNAGRRQRGNPNG